jgi:hypothetical protein
VRARERGRARAGQQYVRGRLHHLARDEHRVPHPRDRRDTARPQILARHHRSIHLHRAVEVQHRAGARVEERIVLEADNRGADRVERRAAAGEHRPPGHDGGTHAGERRGGVGRGPAAAPAVDDDRIAQHRAAYDARP